MNELLEASKKQLTKHLEKGNITENEIALSKILDELSQLQQEKEELIKWIEEETLRLSESVKHIESRSVLNRTPQLYIEKGAISMLKEILSKLKESGTGDKDNI